MNTNRIRIHQKKNRSIRILNRIHQLNFFENIRICFQIYY
jgi:hypothetical protein